MRGNRILGYRARNRSKILLHILVIGLLLIVLSSFQVAFLSKLRFLGAVPDLMLCTVLCMAYFSGRYTGATTGIAAGFLIEALGSQGISLLPVFYLLVGYIAGHYAKAIIPKRYTVYLLYLICVLFLRAGVTVTYTCLTYAQIYLPHILLYTVLPEMAGTALVGIVLYFPMKPVCRRLEK